MLGSCVPFRATDAKYSASRARASAAYAALSASASAARSNAASRARSCADFASSSTNTSLGVCFERSIFEAMLRKRVASRRRAADAERLRAEKEEEVRK